VQWQQQQGHADHMPPQQTQPASTSQPAPQNPTARHTHPHPRTVSPSALQCAGIGLAWSALSSSLSSR
jgi:hypothetical protein